MASSPLSGEVEKCPTAAFYICCGGKCRKCWVSVSSGSHPSRTENNVAPAATVLLEWQNDCWKIVINQAILRAGDCGGAGDSGTACKWIWQKTRDRGPERVSSVWGGIRRLSAEAALQRQQHFGVARTSQRKSRCPPALSVWCHTRSREPLWIRRGPDISDLSRGSGVISIMLLCSSLLPRVSIFSADRQKNCVLRIL